MTDQATLAQFISTQLLSGKERVTPGLGDNLLLSGLIDSLGIVQLIKFIEKENGIKVAAGEITLKNFKTINAMVDFIEKKRQAS